MDRLCEWRDTLFCSCFGLYCISPTLDPPSGNLGGTKEDSGFREVHSALEAGESDKSEDGPAVGGGEESPSREEESEDEKEQLLNQHLLEAGTSRTGGISSARDSISPGVRGVSCRLQARLR